MEGLARLAAIVAAVAASDEEVVGLVERGELTEEHLRAEVPRLLRAALAAEARGLERYRVDAAYAEGLLLAIYEQVVHEAGLRRIRALGFADPEGPPRSLAWYRGEG